MHTLPDTPLRPLCALQKVTTTSRANALVESYWARRAQVRLADCFSQTACVDSLAAHQSLSKPNGEHMRTRLP